MLSLFSGAEVKRSAPASFTLRSREHGILRGSSTGNAHSFPEKQQCYQIMFRIGRRAGISPRKGIVARLVWFLGGEESRPRGEMRGFTMAHIKPVTVLKAQEESSSMGDLLQALNTLLQTVFTFILNLVDRLPKDSTSQGRSF